MAASLYLIFGPQGSGKSTQGERLAHKLHLPLFDSGQELRRLALETSELGQKVTVSMNSGQLVSNEILHEVIDEFLAKNDTTRGLVMDGFPRTMANCELLEHLIPKHDWQVMGIVIQISEKTVYDRLTKRSIEEKRPDDKPEFIAKRLAGYRAQTVPVIEWLKKHYTLIEIDGEPDVDKVTEEVYTALKLNV